MQILLAGVLVDLQVESPLGTGGPWWSRSYNFIFDATPTAYAGGGGGGAGYPGISAQPATSRRSWWWWNWWHGTQVDLQTAGGTNTWWWRWNRWFASLLPTVVPGAGNGGSGVVIIRYQISIGIKL